MEAGEAGANAATVPATGTGVPVLRTAFQGTRTLVRG